MVAYHQVACQPVQAVKLNI